MACFLLQLAPTMLDLLGLDYTKLQGVQIEGTKPLPGLPTGALLLHPKLSLLCLRIMPVCHREPEDQIELHACQHLIFLT